MAAPIRCGEMTPSVRSPRSADTGRPTGANLRLMLTEREGSAIRPTPGERELLLGLLIEYHELVIEFRGANPKSPDYHQLVRREAHIRRRISRLTAG